MAERAKRRERILIFQIGSLGDTVIAMPCYREIARRHPGATRILLTNFPQSKMVQAEALLRPCGLIDDVVEYPMPLRGMAHILALLRQIRALQIDRLYYLTPEKRVLNLLRHAGFFKACGIAPLHGLPWTRDLRYPREVIPGKLWESEASRLLRSIKAQQQPAAPASADRVLDLTPAEQGAAGRLLAESSIAGDFLAISVGGKVPINDWGDRLWARVLGAVSAAHPGLGAVFVGSAEEHPRNEALARAWTGPTLNSCGRLTPRETAALIGRATLFAGHDTGTLHLAAAVDTRIVGVYSARNVPGKWYSDRPGDRFFYHQPPCFGCELELPGQCPHGLVCMTAHRPEEIASSIIMAVDHA